MWFVVQLATAWGAECPEEAPDPAALDRAVALADEAVEALDPTALAAATAALDALLVCRGQPVSVGQAAQVHRIHGITSFVTGDEAGADVWFAASRALEPTGALGHAIGGPLQSAWNRAVTDSPPERVELARPKRGALVVDGQLVPSRPAHLPYVFQHVDGGEVLVTSLHPVGAAGPVYPGSPKPEPEPGTPTRRGKPLSIAFVAVGAASVGSLAGAAWTRSRYNDASLTNDEVAGLLPANRALGIGGYALAGTAVGLGTVALAVEW
ncbi:MAG: hypothetical protein H6737_29335 [Alphaproteobacteria bacterium]|nr:hypothetical protein [Alphaproteobacteria bacterium]